MPAEETISRLTLEQWALGMLEPAKTAELERARDSDPDLAARMDKVRAEIKASEMDMPQFILPVDEPERTSWLEWLLNPQWAIGLAVAAAALFFPVTAQADLSTADITALSNGAKGRVLSADGAILGTIDGVSFSGERARLFVLTRGGNIFRRTGGKDIVVTTETSQLTRRGNDLIMDADAQRVRIKANKSFTDDSSPITILLLDR